MAFLGNLRIGARLALVLAGVLLLTAAVALAGIAGVNTLHQAARLILAPAGRAPRDPGGDGDAFDVASQA